MSQHQQDLYARITSQIVQTIERGIDDWQMPWHVQADGVFFPTNAVSQLPYRGVNTVILWAAAQERGFDSGLWGTYRQWQALGAQVRKGERGTPIVVWKSASGIDAETEGSDEQPGRPRLFARSYTVFNVAQVDGYTPEPVPELPESERIAFADAFFTDLGATIKHGGCTAYYDRVTDHIQMPRFVSFKEPLGYYSTLAHELTHWTGAPHRLDRDLSGRFGSARYAMEELIAELGAAFLMASLGLSVVPRDDHAGYVFSWLRTLKEDSRAVFTAASRAQHAVDWMFAQVAELKRVA
jgi:antirestriction protein ArdC